MKLEQVDLNLLHVLHVVLEEGSVSAAADRLHVTAPAVSNGLRRLRELMGDPLFVRSGRGLTPTPRALELRVRLARVFDELNQTLDAGTFDPRTTTRKLTLALSDSEQLTSLPDIAQSFSKRLPRASLRVVSVDVLISTGGLAGTEVDLVIGPTPAEDDVRFTPLFEEQGAFVVRRGHPRVRTKLTKVQFNTERHVDVHIALGRGGVGHRVAETAFAQHGLVRAVALSVPTFAAAAWVAASSDLVAGIPLRLARALARKLPLRIVAGPLPAFRFPMCMAWHQRTDCDPAAACLRDIVKETAGAP